MPPALDDLHHAARRGDHDAVVKLLQQRADVNAFDEDGHTPLHYAAAREHLDVVTTLLAAGADVNARYEPSAGNTPLREIAATCSFAMAKLLVDAGADPLIPGWMQLTALDKAQNRKRGEGPRVLELLQRAARPRR